MTMFLAVDEGANVDDCSCVNEEVLGTPVINRSSHDCSTYRTRQVWKACFLMHRTGDLEFRPQTS